MKTVNPEKARQLGMTSSLVAYANDEKRKILAAYEVWKFIRQSNQLPVVQKVFRENQPVKGG